MIDLRTIGAWIRTLPADKELVDAMIAAYEAPTTVRLENAVAAVAAAYGGTTTRDPATGRVSTISPPDPAQAQPGGHPSGANRGGLMAPGT